jgi:hypothetical protein
MIRNKYQYHWDLYQVYPNPTSELIYVNSNLKSDYDLFNVVGQKIG